MRRADRSPRPSPRDECGALPEGSAEGTAAQKKPARPRLGAWEGEVDPDTVNEILLDYIRAYDWIEMEDQGITEIQQAKRLGMKRQRLDDIHSHLKTVTIPTSSTGAMPATSTPTTCCTNSPQTCRINNQHQPCQQAAI
jgi:hypothetical protein